jgi:hypothetical protein
MEVKQLKRKKRLWRKKCVQSHTENTKEGFAICSNPSSFEELKSQNWFSMTWIFTCLKEKSNQVSPFPPRDRKGKMDLPIRVYSPRVGERVVFIKSCTDVPSSVCFF